MAILVYFPIADPGGSRWEVHSLPHISTNFSNIRIATLKNKKSKIIIPPGGNFISTSTYFFKTLSKNVFISQNITLNTF